MRKAFGIAIASATVMVVTPAAAASFEDIAGRWCSDFGSEQFTHDTLTVIRKSDGSRSVYPIVRYAYQGTRVTVYWKNGKAEVSTDFGEFSGDGRRMKQLKTDQADVIPHHRC